MPFPKPTEEDSSFVAFTKAERIQQLNDIDKSITKLLQSAGLALKILTTTQSSDAPVHNRREAFENAANGYLKTLQSVDVRLKRQVLGLEEADIIVGEKKDKEAQEEKEDEDPLAVIDMSKSRAVKEVENGGMGKLDIGWLNSRSGKVGRDNEAELWGKARKFLEDMEKGRDDGEGDKNMES